VWVFEHFCFANNRHQHLCRYQAMRAQTGAGMQLCDAQDVSNRKSICQSSAVRSFFAVALLLSTFAAVSSQPSYAIPAFARKYGLPCSACHIGWPILNVFGQQFRDNGFQIGNDRDSPIYQNPAYWPITFRITPNWHLESQTKVAVDPTATAPRGRADHQYHRV
jgi:hypothetical protein